MKVIIHSGISPFDTLQLKNTLQANRNILLEKSIFFSCINSKLARQKEGRQPKDYARVAKKIANKSRLINEQNATLIILTEATSQILDFSFYRELEKFLEKKIAKSIQWTLAFRDPYDYFNQAWALNIINPKQEFSQLIAYRDLGLKACKAGGILINSLRKSKQLSYILDYPDYLQKLSEHIEGQIYTIKSSDMLLDPAGSQSSFINWIAGTQIRLEQVPSINPKQDPREWRSKLGRENPDPAQLQYILTRKFIQETGHAYNLKGFRASWKDITKAISEQRTWIHKQERQELKKAFLHHFSNYTTVHEKSAYWMPIPIKPGHQTTDSRPENYGSSI